MFGNLRIMNGIVFVYSVIDRKSFLEAKALLELAQNEDPKDIPKVLLGTKIDLDAGKEGEEGARVVGYDEAQDFAEKNGMVYFEISLKTRENIEKPFELLAKKSLEKIERLEEMEESIKLRKQKERDEANRSCGSCGP